MTHFGTAGNAAFHRSPIPRFIAPKELRYVETFLIIFLTWITPGVLLFAYLLWISKRVRRGTSDAPPVQLRGPLADKTDSHAHK
jgi:hypothetical protein